MKTSRFSLFLKLLIILPFINNIHAQVNTIEFVHLLSENGLSQNTTHAILEDSYGYLWFATEDGLNKYDGYNFTIYKYNPLDSTSISDNFIWTMYEGRDSTLWIGTNSGGLCKFDRERESFISYKNNPEDPNSLTLNNVRTILEDSDGDLWVGTENGLDKFDRKNNLFIHYKNNPANPNSLSNNVVLSLCQDKDGIIWIGSDGGLDKFEKPTGKFFNYSFSPRSSNSLNSNVVLTIYEDNSEDLWLGTLYGLTKFSKKTKKFEKYLTTPTIIKNLLGNRVNSVFKDKTGTLWVGTGDGLYQFENSNKRFTKINSARGNSNILSNNNILCVYENKSGIIWIGTAEDGIVKFDREKIKFHHFRHEPGISNSLSYKTIRSIYHDDKGILWIGTLGGGLNRYDEKNNKFYFYKNNPDDRYSLSDNQISAIFKDSYGYLWVGTWSGGLNRSINPLTSSNINNLKFINYRNDSNIPKSISSDIIQAIFEDTDHTLWIGTGSGLDVYNRKTDGFINFNNNVNDPNSLSSNQVQSCVIEDRHGNLWIGTWDGLSKLSNSRRKNIFQNPDQLKFDNFKAGKNGISDNRVISAYEDDSGNIWFGTYGGGINVLKKDQQGKDNPEFEYLTINDGLTSNIIYCILGDENNNIWISSDNGLSMLDQKTKKILNYDVSDGLQGNQFYWGACFKGKDGELYFGGTNGFNAFNPRELIINTNIPPIVITDFQIFNQPVKINSNGSPLHKSISATKEIKLSYNQNVFSFEFAALDFASPNKNQYAYMMEGFDKEWIYSGNRRFVTYTNLDPGKYIFKVKGSNNDGIWNETGTSLAIIISPPLWREWWFILLVILFVGGLITAIIYLKVKNLLGIERFRAKLAADLHDNIGASLTEISILSEVISKKITSADSEIRKSLHTISDNSRDLIDSMSDIVWLVNPKRDSLYDLILRLRDTYSELSSYTSISFRSENIKNLEKVSLSMEHRQHLYLIFKEAINNSITHSECNQITLDASVKGKKLEMILKDNGKGFEEGIINSGNGLSNIKDRARSIGGEIKILTVLNEGTTVQFVGNIL